MREGWKTKKLGDLADLQRGLTYSKGDEVPFSSKRVLRSNNIDLERKRRKAKKEREADAESPAAASRSFKEDYAPVPKTYSLRLFIHD